MKTNVVPGEHRYLDVIRSQLARLFLGEESSEFDIPLAPIGSDFQMRVWNAPAFNPGSRDALELLDRAERLGIPGARRRAALGRANGTNMLSNHHPGAASRSTALTAHFADTAAASGERNGCSITSGDGKQSDQ